MKKQLLHAVVACGFLWGISGHAADAPREKRVAVGEVRSPGARRSIVLPDYCNTPDAMAVLSDGSVILSAPNFTDPSSPGVLLKVAANDEVSLFCRLPVHPQTGRVYPMGVRQAPSGDLYVADCQCMEKPPRISRLLRVRVARGKPGAVEVVARGLNVANGVAIRGDFVYVTDSSTGKTADGDAASAVYRFRLDERDAQVKPGGDDPRLVATLKTRSKEIPVGADGIDFDEQGNLYVANCGDGILEKIVLGESGRAVRQEAFTAPGRMKSADGLFYDRQTQRLYVADILANAIRSVDRNGRVETVAQNGDCDGSAGLLDGPSEVVVRGRELIAANFDRVFPGSVNTRSNTPHTLAVLRRDK